MLTAPPPLSDNLPPFRWPRTVDEIQQQVRTVEAASKQALDAVAAVADGHETFENVIEPLMSVPHYKTNPMVCQAKFLQHCSTQPEVRAAADAAGTAFAALKASGRTRADVYSKVKAFSVSAACAGLSKHNSHFVSSLLASFEASGLGLSTEEQARLQELRETDAAVCSAFKKNLAEDTTALFFAAEELDGVDPKWVAERTQPEGGSQAGQVKVTLKYPDLLPVLSTCAVSATRERLSRAREVEAYANNLELVAQGVTLRRRIAVLLGRSSWAHHATATRMSGSPAAVEAFSAPLLARAKAGAARDLEALRVLKVAHLRERGELDAADGADRVRLLAHDVAFYSSERLKREYGVDQEAVRAYFPLDHVVETTMAIYQELLGLVFHQVDQFDTWHPKARYTRTPRHATPRPHTSPAQLARMPRLHATPRTPRHATPHWGRAVGRAQFGWREPRVGWVSGCTGGGKGEPALPRHLQPRSSARSAHAKSRPTYRSVCRQDRRAGCLSARTAVSRSAA